MHDVRLPGRYNAVRLFSREFESVVLTTAGAAQGGPISRRKRWNDRYFPPKCNFRATSIESLKVALRRQVPRRHPATARGRKFPRKMRVARTSTRRERKPTKLTISRSQSSPRDRRAKGIARYDRLIVIRAIHSRIYFSSPKTTTIMASASLGAPLESVDGPSPPLRPALFFPSLSPFAGCCNYFSWFRELLEGIFSSFLLCGDFLEWDIGNFAVV